MGIYSNVRNGKVKHSNQNKKDTTIAMPLLRSGIKKRIIFFFEIRI